jgi:hypothetical protein
MAQAQAGMQECLVVFARSVEVLHQPPQSHTIEVQERGPNVAPSWRDNFTANHGYEPFRDGLLSDLFDSLKLHDLRKVASTMPDHWHMICSPRNQGV